MERTRKIEPKCQENSLGLFPPFPLLIVLDGKKGKVLQQGFFLPWYIPLGNLFWEG